MPATLNPAMTAANSAPAAQMTAATGTGNDAVGSDPSSMGNGDVAPFAALFQQLLGKSLPGDGATLLKAGLMTADTNGNAASKVDAASMTDALSAMLPFLEGMGLIPAKTANADGHEARTPHDLETDALPTGDMALAIPVTPAVSQPAIPAAAAALPANAESDASAVAGLAWEAQGKASVQSGSVVDPGLRRDPQQEHDFAKDLVAAIDGNKDDTRPQANALQAAHTAPASAAARVQTAALPVNHAVGSANWGQEVGNQVVWMANRNESRAELLLTPPQMGRVEVSLNVSGDQATASFVSGNPAVRDALEAALPRLREILADAGIQLGQAQVSAENPHQSAQQEKNGDNFGARHTDRLADAPLATGEISQGTPAATLKLGRGLVDVFA